MSNATVTAYFYTEGSADEVARALEGVVQVEIAMVSPVEGRPWKVEMTPNPGLSPMSMFPDEQMLALITRQVMSHGGLTTTPQRTAAMARGETNRLMTPLPDSVLDRYYAEHPGEDDFRKTAKIEDPDVNDLESFFGSE